MGFMKLLAFLLVQLYSVAFEKIKRCGKTLTKLKAMESNLIIQGRCLQQDQVRKLPSLRGTKQSQVMQDVHLRLFLYDRNDVCCCY